jgi:hypothetical protein
VILRAKSEYKFLNGQVPQAVSVSEMMPRLIVTLSSIGALPFKKDSNKKKGGDDAKGVFPDPGGPSQPGGRAEQAGSRVRVLHLLE